MLSAPLRTEFDAVVFDMDGTLVDSEGHYCQAYILAMESFGATLTPHDYFTRLAGNTDDAIDLLLHAELDGQVDLPTIRKTWYAEYHRLRGVGGVPLLPGAGELLELIAAEGLPMAVASAAMMSDIELNLELAEVRGHFAALSSGEEVTHTKPAPDVYLLAAERLGVEPKRCLAFEDTNSGARAAITAGMHTYMVPHRCEADSFARQHAMGIAKSLTEIVQGLR